MGVIIQWFESLWESIMTLFEVIGWLLQGLLGLGTVMRESINIFSEIISFLPEVVVSTMIAVCGGLIVFRIFGRS